MDRLAVLGRFCRIPPDTPIGSEDAEPNHEPVAIYSFTDYFETEVMRKRPYLKREWCIAVLESPVHSEPQEHNRYRFWGRVAELQGLYLRVVTLEDKVTIHNAFPDRRFKP